MKIRKSTKDDAQKYQELCYEVYRETYIYPELGFDESLLSREIFFDDETTAYFNDLVSPTENKTCFLAEEDNGELLGGIVVYENESDCLVSGYYVRMDRQGQGIGAALWNEAERLIDSRTTKLTVHAHAWRSVNAYFNKGFVIDHDQPTTIAHWSEWPEDKKFLMYCMIRKGRKSVPKPAVQTSMSMPTLEAVKLYADGGSRGNPGPSAGGYVILDMADTVVKSNGKYLGVTTNNQAEYHSLKGGLEMAKQLGIQEVDVYMDSLLVVNQMKGIFKIKNRDLWPIHDAIKKLLPSFKKVTFTHVPRELNKLADAEVNKALDAVSSS